MYSYILKSFYKQNIYHLLIIVLLFSFQLELKSQNNYSKNRIIVIDPGHGGKDSGAVGKKAKEKDLVLKIGLKVGKYIEENIDNAKVIYTRKTDVFIPLHKRAEIANKNNADLFISIHVNANKNTRPFGTETFVMGLHKTQGNLEVAQKENAVIVFEEDYSTKYEGYDPNSAESFIIFSLIQNAYLEQSLELSTNIQYQFREKAQRKDRGVKQAGFLVLWNTSMPSVLVETGFLSNIEEEKYLMTEQGQDYISSAIYRAVKEYFKKLDEIDNSGQDYLAQDSLKIINDSMLIVSNDSLNSLQDTTQIFFKIQISSSSKQIPVDSAYFKGLPYVWEYKVDNTYKYTVGNSKDFKEIKKLKTDVKKKFSGAFIVAFKNGTKIPVNKALKEIKN